jgi:hypothetical protein
VIRINGKQRWKTFAKKKDAEDYLDRNSTDVRDASALTENDPPLLICRSPFARANANFLVRAKIRYF